MHGAFMSASFKTRLAKAELYENMVVKHFRNLGFYVVQPPTTARFMRGDTDRHDFYIKTSGGDLGIEVKARSVAFSSPEEWPYDTVAICSEKHLAKVKKAFVVIVSEHYHSADKWLCTSVNIDAPDGYSIVSQWDGQRGVASKQVSVPKDKLCYLNELLEVWMTQ